MAERVPSTHPSAHGLSGHASPPAAAEPDALVRRARGARRFQLRHRARQPLEWDLRLESADGAADWWLPRGLPWTPDEARAALPEPVGDAPAGQAWDKGDARVLVATEEELVLELEGRRVRGRYAVRREPAGSWSVERLDPATMRPMPDRVLPMLAHGGDYPKDEDAWAFELKWDGIRALAHIRDGRAIVRSRNLSNLSDQYPEMQQLAQALEGHEVLLDGEIVALDERGHASFQRLQGRMGVTARAAVRQKMKDIPIVFVAFDILHLDGQDTMPLPYEERRALLESLQLSGPHWQVPPVVYGDGRALLAVPGAEGIVAKRLGSAYEQGARAATWRKIKEQRRQELVIGGYTAGKGARRGGIGSLMMGYYDDAGEFRYAGNVGTGFNQKTLVDLERKLAPHRRATSPFADRVDKDGTFVEPVLVAEIEFTEWTREGHLRHPSFKGLRDDKEARTVVREES